MKNILYIEVMLNGRFICQLPYMGFSYIENINGNAVMVSTEEDIKKYIESKRPSLKGKDYKVKFTNDRL